MCHDLSRLTTQQLILIIIDGTLNHKVIITRSDYKVISIILYPQVITVAV